MLLKVKHIDFKKSRSFNLPERPASSRKSKVKKGNEANNKSAESQTGGFERNSCNQSQGTKACKMYSFKTLINIFVF